MPVEIAKISRPALRNVLERREKLGRLESVLDAPVVWVAGPAGSGKTTLVSDFIRRGKRPCLWYQMDERDGDPGTFFHYMKLAINKALSRRKNQVPSFSPESLQGLMGFTLTFFEKVFHALKQGSLLVFDNYQMVPDDALLHQLMKKCLSIVPRGMNIVVISRRSPPKALVEFLADNTMAVFLWEDLKLSLDEARDILALRTNYSYSTKEVKHLHDITDGWVSGLTLWAQAALFSRSAPVWTAADTPEEIFDYFASEIFASTPPEMTHFLIATSFLPRMNVAMANKIAGTTRARDILMRLVRQQYFILNYGHSNRFYAYHQLFRSFLQARARETLDREELNRYRQTAGRLLTEIGDIDDAARLLIESRAFDELAELVTTHALTLVGQGRHTLILNWMETFPDQMLAENTWLVYWLGVARSVISPETSCRNFETAFHAFSENGDRLGRLLAWSGIVDARALQFSQFQGFDKWIQVFEQDLKADYLSIPDGEIQCRVASSFFKALVLRQPHHPGIEDWAEQALVKSSDRETLNMRSWTYVRLQFYYFAIKTDTLRLQEIAAELKRVAAAHPLTSPMAEINVHYTKMMAMQITGRFRRSLSALATYRIVAEKSGIRLFDPFFSMHEASIYLDMNNAGKAAEVLKRMHRRLDAMNPWVKSLYYFQRARAGMMNRDDASIEADTDKAYQLAKDVGCHYTTLICLLQRVYVHHIRGRAEDAWTALNRYFAHIKNRASDQDMFMGLLTRAHLLFQCGKERQGVAALRQGLATGKRHDLLFVFSDQPTVTADLCVKALAENVEVPYVRTIIRRRQLQPGSMPITIQNWPWPVKIQSLGSFEVYIHDEPIHLSRKSPKKIFQLLKAILAYRNDKVPVAWLMDNLWPDAEGDRAMESLKVSVKRLRKLLENPRTVLWKESFVWLNPQLVWVDLAAFESLHGALGRQPPLPPESMRGKIRAAIHLIKGRFLEGDDSLPVFISCRSELEILCAHLFQLALSHEQSNQTISELIALSKKAISDPNLSRAIHSKLLTLVSKNGN